MAAAALTEAVSSPFHDDEGRKEGGRDESASDTDLLYVEPVRKTRGRD